MSRVDLKDFLSNPAGWPTNAWLYIGDPICLQVYVRKSKRIFNGKRRQCLEIANIETDAEERGKGIYTRWLESAEEIARQAGYEVIYHENIFNERLIPFYEKRGYVLIPGLEFPCMIKALS